MGRGTFMRRKQVLTPALSAACVWRNLASQVLTEHVMDLNYYSCARIRDAPPRLYRNDAKARANFCFCELEQRGLKGLWQQRGGWRGFDVCVTNVEYCVFATCDYVRKERRAWVQKNLYLSYSSIFEWMNASKELNECIRNSCRNLSNLSALSFDDPFKKSLKL